VEILKIGRKLHFIMTLAPFFKRYLVFLLYLSGEILSVKAQTKISAQQYISQYQPVAQQLESTYGIPSAVMLGIGMYESNYGNSKVCRLLHNHHGLAGKNNLQKTHQIKSRYRYFETDSLGYVGFCTFISTRKYFATVSPNLTVEEWLTLIGRNGYCQNPSIWKKHILQILKQQGIPIE
jgi:flagellum-specific peptidoglycan hydrolase FlgJ